MRVIMIGPSRNACGGVASVAEGYFKAGIERKCDIRYISTVDDGTRLHKLRMAAMSYCEFSRSLKEFDIVHVHMSLRASFERKKYFIRRAKKKGKKVLLHIHEGEFPTLYEAASPSKKKSIRQLLLCVDKLVVLSSEWREYFKTIGVEPSRIAVIYNSVQVPQEPTAPLSSHAILFLGRLGYRKDPETLLRAAKCVVNRESDVHFYFGGDGEIDAYEDIARKLGIIDNCHFLGWVSEEEREQLFHTCSIFCLPSRNEGMPMGILEAMAHGLVAVATPVGGVPEIVENGKTGFLTSVGDSDGLADVLLHVLRDEELRRNVSLAGYKRIVRDFNIDDRINDILALYRELS